MIINRMTFHRHRTIAAGLACAMALVGLSARAFAQPDCGVARPDAVIGVANGVANYASANGIEAFAVGFSHCNFGLAPLNFMFSSSQHPVTGQNLHRLMMVDGAWRIEQIGMSWLHHGFFALSQQACCTNCEPTNGATLGVRCSSPESANIAGQQVGLGPRWHVNAATGAFPFPAANAPFTGSIARRLQAHITDIDPALNPGAQYFVEFVVVAADDAAAGNDLNNASYQPAVISGSGDVWTMALSATPMQRGEPAISAWKAIEPAVVQANVDVPGDGRFIVASHAAQLGNGLWRYEYAIENLNSDRSAASFTVTLPEGAKVMNIGFHDVDYHSGDGIGNVTTDGTDWTLALDSTSLTWNTESFVSNPNANALRWGTLYNFRFDSDVAPALGAGSIDLFKPGPAEGPDAMYVDVIAPGDAPSCPGDIDGSGAVGVSDLLAVISAWGPCPAPCAADVAPPTGGDGAVGVADLLAVISAWGPC